ncbi:hypothetical protein BB560_004581 [Smittium megazygosporum]|uniref:DH domain-containing protein n=1 Tax=Smittium megazygosporum TaxID=133381 RepID=A0A2T9Z8U1_9FUNG|nr:hypothetical protein BB560_004581 [Smittium megazygosporum]
MPAILNYSKKISAFVNLDDYLVNDDNDSSYLLDHCSLFKNKQPENTDTHSNSLCSITPKQIISSNTNSCNNSIDSISISSSISKDNDDIAHSKASVHPCTPESFDLDTTPQLFLSKNTSEDSLCKNRFINQVSNFHDGAESSINHIPSSHSRTSTQSTQGLMPLSDPYLSDICSEMGANLCSVDIYLSSSELSDPEILKIPLSGSNSSLPSIYKSSFKLNLDSVIQEEENFGFEHTPSSTHSKSSEQPLCVANIPVLLCSSESKDMPGSTGSNFSDTIGGNTPIETVEFCKTRMKLLSFPDSLFSKSAFSKITKIDLSFNKISSWPEQLSLISNLKTLVLKRNKLPNLPKDIKFLVNLEYLDLSNNQIQTIGEEITTLEKLCVLKLSNNLVCSIPHYLGKLHSHLDILEIDGNPLDDLSLSLVFPILNKTHTKSQKKSKHLSISNARSKPNLKTNACIEINDSTQDKEQTSGLDSGKTLVNIKTFTTKPSNPQNGFSDPDAFSHKENKTKDLDTYYKNKNKLTEILGVDIPGPNDFSCTAGDNGLSSISGNFGPQLSNSKNPSYLQIKREALKTPSNKYIVSDITKKSPEKKNQKVVPELHRRKLFDTPPDLNRMNALKASKVLGITCTENVELPYNIVNSKALLSTQAFSKQDSGGPYRENPTISLLSDSVTDLNIVGQNFKDNFGNECEGLSEDKSQIDFSDSEASLLLSTEAESDDSLESAFKCELTRNSSIVNYNPPETQKIPKNTSNNFKKQKTKSVLMHLLDAWDLDENSSERAEIQKILDSKVYVSRKRASSCSNKPVNNGVSLKKYFQTACELLETEEAYVEGLKKVINVYYIPLEEIDILSKAEVKSLFSNIRVIYELHSKHLLCDLQKEKDNGFANLGSVMHSTADLSHLRISGKPMASLDNHVDANLMDLDYYSLPSLLISPVQRVPRYKLLLEKLLKYANHDTKDYPLLDQAYEQISLVAIDINESKRKHEQKNQSKLGNYEVWGSCSGNNCIYGLCKPKPTTEDHCCKSDTP